jgi:hypothetical protein
LGSDESFSEYDETAVALGSDVMDSGSDEDLLVLEGIVEIFYFGPLSAGDEDGFEERVVSVLIDLVVDDSESLILFHVAKISC